MGVLRRVSSALLLGLTLVGLIGCVVSAATGRWSGLAISAATTAVYGLLFALSRSRRTRSSSDALAQLRALTIVFGCSLVLFGIVIARIPNLPNGSVWPWLPILVVVAVFATGAIERAERPFTCTSPTALAGAYRTRFFLRLAFAETPALLAFTFVFIGARTWIYYLGAAFSILRIATSVAPTRAALARDQAQLDAAGCGLSLVAALTGPGAT